MTLEEIEEEWGKDSIIDPLRYGELLADVQSLQAKYLRYYNHERMVLREIERKMREFRLPKYIHYMQGPSEETKHWYVPPVGKVIKQDIPMYLDADQDMNQIQSRIDLAATKVNALEIIVNAIKYRSKTIEALMSWAKWQGGA